MLTLLIAFGSSTSHFAGKIISYDFSQAFSSRYGTKITLSYFIALLPLVSLIFIKRSLKIPFFAVLPVYIVFSFSISGVFFAVSGVLIRMWLPLTLLLPINLTAIKVFYPSGLTGALRFCYYTIFLSSIAYFISSTPNFYPIDSYYHGFSGYLFGD
jgi:hypothetical protein